LEEDEGEAPLPNFLRWCQKVSIQLNQSAEASVWQYGVLTREDLPAGEVICSIPRSAALVPVHNPDPGSTGERYWLSVQTVFQYSVRITFPGEYEFCNIR
ncbi:unnamed protein product, partial [Ranitomeya imitator]